MVLLSTTLRMRRLVSNQDAQLPRHHPPRSPQDDTHPLRRRAWLDLCKNITGSRAAYPRRNPDRCPSRLLDAVLRYGIQKSPGNAGPNRPEWGL